MSPERQTTLRINWARLLALLMLAVVVLLVIVQFGPAAFGDSRSSPPLQGPASGSGRGPR